MPNGSIVLASWEDAAVSVVFPASVAFVSFWESFPQPTEEKTIISTNRIDKTLVILKYFIIILLIFSNFRGLYIFILIRNGEFIQINLVTLPTFRYMLKLYLYIPVD